MNTATAALALTLATATIAHAQVSPDDPGIETRRSLSALDFSAAPFDIETGLVGGPEDCSPAIDCAQPGDFTVFINASFFDSAEVMEFAADAALTRLCTTFVFAGGSCPADPEDPIYSTNWAWEFFAIDAGGVPSTAPPARFDTDAPLANMTAEPVFTGVIGAGFPVFFFSFDLLGGGHPVSAGECFALQPKFALPGCSAFWETSSNEDGSPSGDGLFLQDALMDGYDTCDYTANDLLLCLDVLTLQPPSCTANLDLDPPANDNCEGASAFPLVCDATTVQCLLFATQNTQDDPALPCAIGEPDNFTGHPTVFYTFTPTSSRALLSMCRVSGVMTGSNAPFPNGDFILAVYEYAQTPGAGEGPCDLVQIACSDDNCSANKPILCLNDLDPMTTYVVQVAGHDDFDGIQIGLDVTCDPMDMPPVPTNDDCIDATPLFFPFIDEFFQSEAVDAMGNHAQGDTTCATLDPIAGSCGVTQNGNSPGVWFTFMGTGMDVLITMSEFCNFYDSQMNVYCGDCTAGLICLVGGDDGPICAPQSTVQLCTETGRQYYIYVHGYFDVGFFELTVRNNDNISGFCDNEPTHDERCVITDIDCASFHGGPPDIDEPNSPAALMEMCGEDINNGCLSDPNSGTAFIEAGLVPFTACGNVFAANGDRDLDAYRFRIEQRSVVSIEMLAEFDPELFLFESDDCTSNVATFNTTGGAGARLSHRTILNPGTYVLTITASDLTGIPCGTTNEYALRVTAAPLGRCCISEMGSMFFDECCITTEAQCAELGGVFACGEDCSPVTYAQTALPPTVPFVSIIGTPNEIVIDGGDGDGHLGDDDAQFIDLLGEDSDLTDASGMPAEFPFKFFGELRDDLAVVSNGNLAFPNASAVILDASPEPIPTPGNASTLNDFIAGLWTDLDPSATGAVSAVLMGAAPFRTLVVEYNAIPLFNAPGTSNTFQIVLFEGTNCVRFLYNDIELPVITDPMSPEYAVGVENQDGTRGASLTEAEIEALDTTSLGSNEALVVEFCPEFEHTPCFTDNCGSADCDQNGVVGFNDLVSMLFELGSTTSPACDADRNGTIEFNDLVTALFLFGPCP